MLAIVTADYDELLHSLETRFASHPVRRFLDFRILELAADRCVMTIEFKPEFDNTTGAVHGGILAMLADTAAAIALSTAFEGEMNFVTSNLSIHFLRRADAALFATATVIKKDASVCVVSVEIRDDSDRQIATSICDFVVLS